MIVYNPHHISRNRLELAQNILNEVPVKHCFITGSFLYKEKYNDIDVFIISRSKKSICLDKVTINMLDFNDLHSLFYHSITKECIAKHILPVKDLKVTISSYWDVVNEAVPTIFNYKKDHKHVRSLVLYTEYFLTGYVLGTSALDKRIKMFRNYKEILVYMKTAVPIAIQQNTKKSYMKRYFYTQAGRYKDFCKYESQKFLYELTQLIVT